MNIAATLADLERIARRPNVYVNADKDWAATLKHLTDLEAEAARLDLPIGNVTKETVRLRNSIGALLGTKDDLGHDRQNHVIRAFGAIAGLKLVFDL